MASISSEEKQTHITLWKESGLNKMEYCKQSGISYSAFCHWVHRYAPSLSPARKKGVKRKTAFIPIALSEEKSIGISAPIEIRYPNGVHVLCPAGVDISILKTLLS